MVLSRVVRPIFRQAQRGNKALSSISYECQTREQFESVWTKRAALQDHHLKMVKEHHMPVHRSGGTSNDKTNMLFYTYGSLVTLACLYQIFGMAV